MGENKFTPTNCPSCGTVRQCTGAPVWEEFCPNKACTHDRDTFRLALSAQHRESERIGRLHAAAPDMLEALKSLVSSLAEADEDGMTEFAEPMVSARAAIAKAEGSNA